MYRRLIESLPVTTYIDEPDAYVNCRYISPQIEALTGWTREEWCTPDFFYEIAHPDDHAILKDVVLRTTMGETVGCEYRLFTKDGREIWVEDISVPEVDATGRTIAIRGFIADIGDRKRLEQEREEARAEYQTLLEELPAVVYVDAADEAGSTMYMSPRIEQILGYSLEAWMSEPDFFVNEILHPDDREHVLSEIAANNIGERNLSEYRCIAADGRVVWFYDESVPQLDSAGNVIATRGCMIEITDLKVAQEERERLQRRLHTLVEHLPGAVFRCAADESLQMEYLSEGIESITGFGSADLVVGGSRPFASIVYPDDLPDVQRRLSEALQLDRAFLVEFRVFAADGGTRWVYVNGRPTTYDEQDAQWLTV